MDKKYLIVIAFFLCVCYTIKSQTIEECMKRFPGDFQFGVASSAHQIEGAWNESGKSLGAWDHFTHSKLDATFDKQNGDIACDAYHKLEEDVNNLKYLGVQFYRFSLSWSRILPSFNVINNEGIDYYNRLINLLLKNNITPLVTIFHWDLPQYIQDLGGFANPEIVDYFEYYASVVFKNFGDRVKLWLTINEPKMYCLFGYGNILAPPGINQSRTADYLCAHNAIKAHARAYHIYNETFKPTQKGRITICLDGAWGEPATDSENDKEASIRFMDFELGWFANPIYSKEGDYPPIMKKLIAKRSREQRYPTSRLPSFTQEEIDYIKGTYDYFSLNYYIALKVRDRQPNDVCDPYNILDNPDAECYTYYEPTWPSTESPFFKVTPWAFSKLLPRIKNEYGNPEIYITENGCPDKPSLIDDKKVSYLKGHLSSVLQAICVHNVNVKAFTAWSYMDSFEWFSGYTAKFGLYHVNFTDPLRTRTPRSSAQYYKKVISTKEP